MIIDALVKYYMFLGMIICGCIMSERWSKWGNWGMRKNEEVDFINIVIRCAESLIKMNNSQPWL